MITYSLNGTGKQADRQKITRIYWAHSLKKVIFQNRQLQCNRRHIYGCLPCIAVKINTADIHLLWVAACNILCSCLCFCLLFSLLQLQSQQPHFDWYSSTGTGPAVTLGYTCWISQGLGVPREWNVVETLYVVSSICFSSSPEGYSLWHKLMPVVS